MTFEEKLKLAMTYPEETEGSRLAEKARQMTNGMSREERKQLFRRAMVRIYGGRPEAAADPIPIIHPQRDPAAPRQSGEERGKILPCNLIAAYSSHA